MTQIHSPKPRLSNATFFLGACLVLVLSAVTMVIGDAFKKAELTFGGCTMRTEIARTPEAQAKGLSDRGVIDNDFAMIFPFNREKPFFWMKGMLVPIDIVWVKDNKVVKVDANLPLDDGATNYQAPEPIDWVVEVAAGRASACDVTADTKLSGLRH
jgi:uncharacterized membrane protein (UPF0127 family)